VFPTELRVYATALSFSDSIWPDFDRRVSLFSSLKIAHHSMATFGAGGSLRYPERDNTASLFQGRAALVAAHFRLAKFIQTEVRRRFDRDIRAIRKSQHPIEKTQLE
jgi:hypothetical protein